MYKDYGDPTTSKISAPGNSILLSAVRLEALKSEDTMEWSNADRTKSKQREYGKDSLNRMSHETSTGIQEAISWIIWVRNAVSTWIRSQLLWSYC
jgi:hypothetical protein